ncbi:DUF6783 domain-containing protein [Robinsoniella peoriensis]
MRGKYTAKWGVQMPGINFKHALDSFCISGKINQVKF